MSNERIGCIGGIFKFFGLIKEIETDNVELMPFALRDDFLSNAEFSFFKVLSTVVDDKYVICPKVGLSDIFFVTNTNGENKMKYLNKINRKHVDFLICEAKTMKPKMGIELDDKSHSRANRVERDKFVDKLFSEAALPLVRFQAKSSYVANEVKEKIENKTSPILKVLTDVNEKVESEKVMCPKCNVEMQLKKATKGKFAGKEFYGCPNYPQCKEILK